MAKVLSVRGSEGATVVGTADAQTSTAPDRNEQPIEEVPILAVRHSTPTPWQPIETAPTETAVLTYRGAGLMSVAENVPDYRGGFEWCCVDGCYLVGVTHWMPLPAPPANAEAVR